MKRLMPFALLTVLFFAFPGTPRAAVPVADEAIFVEGARYDAVLDTHQRRWRLLPAQGKDLVLRVSESCHPGKALPPGLWLLTQGPAGQPTLVAPSATPLPSGHPGQVRLVTCEQAVADDLPAMAVPKPLLDWLSAHSGTIYVPR